jgi:translation initiation factor IF-2
MAAFSRNLTANQRLSGDPFGNQIRNLVKPQPAAQKPAAPKPPAPPAPKPPAPKPPADWGRPPPGPPPKPDPIGWQRPQGYDGPPPADWGRLPPDFKLPDPNKPAISGGPMPLPQSAPGIGPDGNLTYPTYRGVVPGGSPGNRSFQDGDMFVSEQNNPNAFFDAQANGRIGGPKTGGPGPLPSTGPQTGGPSSTSLPLPPGLPLPPNPFQTPMGGDMNPFNPGWYRGPGQPSGMGYPSAPPRPPGMPTAGGLAGFYG